MKLSDIVVQEAEGAQEDGKLIELSELKEYFPNTYKKAVKSLAKSGRLVWNGAQVFTKSGDYGPALENAVAEAEQFLNDRDTTIDVTLELDGAVADIDEHSTFTSDYPVNENQEVYVGYDTRNNTMLVGFDVWLDEEIFNQDFDREFEETFGEDFNMGDADHEKIFNNVHTQFKEEAFHGVLVAVSVQGKLRMDIALGRGFYKGIYNSKVRSFSDTADFRLD